jgi:hypothetical protein
MTPPEIDEDDSTSTEAPMNRWWAVGLVVLTLVVLGAGAITLVRAENLEVQRDDAVQRYADVTNAPTPTITTTVTVTLPPKTLPPVTIRVTERASRSNARKPASSLTSRPRSEVRLDLRHARLWDRIAACESGQRWSLNTGLYDGGLQFLPSTWRSWGGTDFAPYAYMATREEQITIANRSTRSRVGEPWLSPWPVCGKRAAAALGYKFP